MTRLAPVQGFVAVTLMKLESKVVRPRAYINRRIRDLPASQCSSYRAHNMELHANHSDPLNTDLLDANNRVLYRITTNGGFLSTRTTTIVKMTPEGRAETFGEIDYHSWSGDVLRFCGRELEARDYLDKSFFGR